MSVATDDQAFEEWVRQIFDHPETCDAGYLALDLDEPPPETTVRYLTKLFESPETILSAYSEIQITSGFWQFLYTSCTDYLRSVLDGQVPLEDRQACIRSIGTLFQQLFAKRCSQTLSHSLSHLGGEARSHLNQICFMWWDMFPTWGESGNNYRVLDADILAVIKGNLTLDSLACQESALHGLGHWQSSYPEFVQTMIEDFLLQRPELGSELREYAHAARDGDVL